MVSSPAQLPGVLSQIEPYCRSISRTDLAGRDSGPKREFPLLCSGFLSHYVGDALTVLELRLENRCATSAITPHAKNGTTESSFMPLLCFGQENYRSPVHFKSARHPFATSGRPGRLTSTAPLSHMENCLPTGPMRTPHGLPRFGTTG